MTGFYFRGKRRPPGFSGVKVARQGFRDQTFRSNGPLKGDTARPTRPLPPPTSPEGR